GVTALGARLAGRLPFAAVNPSTTEPPPPPKKEEEQRLSNFITVVSARPPDRARGGEPLRIGSQVSRPAPIPGVKAWTIETTRYGASGRKFAFSADGKTMMILADNWGWVHFDLASYTRRPDVPNGGTYHS